VIEKWRVEYNTKRPHSALGYRPPAPAAFEIGRENGCGKDAPESRGLENAARFPLSHSPGDDGLSSPWSIA
jgi:putative transposase